MNNWPAIPTQNFTAIHLSSSRNSNGITQGRRYLQLKLPLVPT